MTNGTLRRAFPYRGILSVLMGAVILYLAVNFVMQTTVSLELRDKLGRIEQEIAAAEKANSGLKARLDYVLSDDAAEEWARENGWARPEEVLVVVMAPEAEALPGDELRHEDAIRPPSTRDSWWDLFFGED